MGHALLLVVVEPDLTGERVEQRVDELMTPFGDDAEIEPYEEECICTYSETDANHNPDSDCEECGRTGTVMTTFNIYANWDWYAPGGRWDGEIQGRDANDSGLAHRVQDNTAVVRDIPADFIAWAILTPDGEWHGGSGHDEKNMDDWSVEHAEILHTYPDHLAVAIDFHY